ncbi:MAG: isoleucine--tRNA ligase [Planctomycetota bacterium]|nr:isoleucine--tRNA ligase [Planctomycetota bacterium]
MYERGVLSPVRSSPFHWCMSCETALADAELEYKDSVAPSIFVLMPGAEGFESAFGRKLDAPAYCLIWTTTPWTLPANVATAVNPRVDYALVRFSSEKLGKGYTVVAQDLLEQVRESTSFDSFEKVSACKGEALEGVTYDHPFMERKGRTILADFVTVEDGTGVVHIAPGHGVDDYVVGMQHGLDLVSPVDHRGCFTDEGERWKGVNVHEADPMIIEFLLGEGLLVGNSKLSHSYPHCWRCKSPVIFRATPQWFVRVDHNGLRRKMLDAIDETRWIPAWGHDRISGMVKDRPDWCISRQRSWGVPIPAFHCNECSQTVLNAEILDAVQTYVSKKGTDGYFAAHANEILPEGYRCPECGSTALEKEKDIFDVWFESGSSFRAAVMSHPQLSFPSDCYLEGTDQHRGWFQLSILPALAAYDEKPVKTIVTHGFIVDEWGQKLSKSRKKVKKSKYDVTAAHDCVRAFGADVVRLWISSVDYREDVMFSEDIVGRLKGSYFAIRNCFRFMLGNLSSFDESQMLDYEELPELDRWVLAELKRVTASAAKFYESFEFHRVFSTVKTFCEVTLSSDYFDMVKDRLYCDPFDSNSGLAARTVLFHLATSLAKVLSPVLVHTCEEIWERLSKHGDLEESVHLAYWPDIPAQWDSDELRDEYGLLFKVRYAVRKRLEELRSRNVINRNEEARVSLFAEGVSERNVLARRLDTLADLFKVAQVELHDEATDEMTQDGTLAGLFIAVRRSEYGKCERCWNHRESVGTRDKHPELCDRCYSAVKTMLEAE